MKKCPKCGKEFPDDFNYCPICLEPLVFKGDCCHN